VIFATGVFNHRPPLSIDEHDRGVANGLLRYCPVCDAYEVRGMRIGVLGSGEHGHKEATFIRGYSASVSLIPTDASMAAARDGVSVLGSSMTGLALSGSQALVYLDNGETRSFDTLYVALGTSVRADLAAGLGVRLASGGCIVVDAKQRTDVEGAYAIGDVTEGLDQIAIAMAHGALAATAIHNDLPSTMPASA
jgi:thioredoxin reductase (NADPH)